MQRKRYNHSMGEFPQPNKIISKQITQKNTQILLNHLKAAKPRIDNSTPKSHNIFKHKPHSKPKVQGLLLDEDHIAKENQMLLDKISVIMHQKYNNQKPQTVNPDYPKSIYQRQKKMLETKFLENHLLQNQNFKMSQRLLNTKSVFNVKQQDKDFLMMTTKNPRYGNKTSQHLGNEQSSNWIDSNVSQSWNKGNFSNNNILQTSQVRDNGVYKKEQYYKLVNKDEEQEKILSQPVVIDNEPYYADIKINNGVFMIELIDMKDAKYYLHLQGKIGRRLYFVECSSNPLLLMKRLKIDKTNQKILLLKALKPLHNLKPLKPLNISYTANLTNRPPLYMSQTIKNQQKQTETTIDVGRSGIFPKTNKSNKIQQNFHNSSIPSRFEFVKGMDKNKKMSSRGFKSNQEKQDKKPQQNQQKTNNDDGYEDEDYYDNDDDYEQEQDQMENKQNNQNNKEENDKSDIYENDQEFEDNNNNEQKNQDNDNYEQDNYEEEYEQDNDNENQEKQQIQKNNNTKNEIKEQNDESYTYEEEEYEKEQNQNKEQQKQNDENYEEEFENEQNQNQEQQKQNDYEEEFENEQIQNKEQQKQNDDNYEEDDYEQEQEIIEEEQQQQKQTQKSLKSNQNQNNVSKKSVNSKTSFKNSQQDKNNTKITNKSLKSNISNQNNPIQEDQTIKKTDNQLKNEEDSQKQQENQTINNTNPQLKQELESQQQLQQNENQQEYNYEQEENYDDEQYEQQQNNKTPQNIDQNLQQNDDHKVNLEDSKENQNVFNTSQFQSTEQNIEDVIVQEKQQNQNKIQEVDDEEQEYLEEEF